jgi:hypothetical protein
MIGMALFSAVAACFGALSAMLVLVFAAFVGAHTANLLTNQKILSGNLRVPPQ